MIFNCVDVFQFVQDLCLRLSIKANREKES